MLATFATFAYTGSGTSASTSKLAADATDDGQPFQASSPKHVVVFLADDMAFVSPPLPYPFPPSFSLSISLSC